MSGISLEDLEARGFLTLPGASFKRLSSNFVTGKLLEREGQKFGLIEGSLYTLEEEPLRFDDLQQVDQFLQKGTDENPAKTEEPIAPSGGVSGQ